MRIKQLLTFLFVVLLMACQGAFAQERFSLDTLETDVVILSDTSQSDIALPIFIGQGELVLFGTYAADADNRQLINFLRKTFPVHPVSKIVIYKSDLSLAMGLPYFRRMYSGLEVLCPRGFGMLMRTDIQTVLQEDSLAGKKRDFGNDDYKFDFQEVKSTIVVVFKGRRLELISQGATYCASSLIGFLPDTKTLLAFEFYSPALNISKNDGSNILKWKESLGKWRFKCPSRVIGGSDCEIYTSYELFLLERELNKIQQNYGEAIAQGLSFEDFAKSYEKAPSEIPLANGRNTLFFIYQQLKKDARGRKPLDKPE